jgi:hypothetical protein
MDYVERFWHREELNVPKKQEPRAVGASLPSVSPQYARHLRNESGGAKNAPCSGRGPRRDLQQEKLNIEPKRRHGLVTAKPMAKIQTCSLSPKPSICEPDWPDPSQAFVEA